MFLNNELIFIHTPKSGGTSVHKLLSDNLGETKTKGIIPPHISYKDLKRSYPSYEIGQKTFAVVRNPFERLVSVYRHLNRPFKLQKFFGENAEKVGAEISTFQDFITNFSLPDAVWQGKDHLTSQLEWVKEVDNIFDLSDTNGIANFLRGFGIKDQLPHLNKRKISSGFGKLYRTYYDDRAIALVEEKFKWEIDTFGYRF